MTVLQVGDVRFGFEDMSLRELFPELRGRMDHVYFPDANHTFTELAAQRELIATVTAWIARRFESVAR